MAHIVSINNDYSKGLGVSEQFQTTFPKHEY